MNNRQSANESRHMNLGPAREVVAVDHRYCWEVVQGKQSRNTRCVFYIALPLTSAHRGSHSGGGAPIFGGGDQSKYEDEGTVYPHSSLVEMITYQSLVYPSIAYRYIDLSHESMDSLDDHFKNETPDIVAITVYSATYRWALIVAARVKQLRPKTIVIFGNDHASLLAEDILESEYGRSCVDFIGLGNNGPFTILGLLGVLENEIQLSRVPSIAYRTSIGAVLQDAPTYPLDQRILPDYRLIREYLERHYDNAFTKWYGNHYSLQRMVTLAIDGGCNWGSDPHRRCKHCSIVGLTPKTADLDQVVQRLEEIVGELSSNVYAAGDSTLGMSKSQWGGKSAFLDSLAERCHGSPILSGRRFMLMYGLIKEFLSSAGLCQTFVRTWNVGIEAFDPVILRANSKGINNGAELAFEAFELARSLDYRVYASGILGLPGSSIATLREEVRQWCNLIDEYSDILTTVSVAAPAIIPGSRMYAELVQSNPDVRAIPASERSSELMTRLYLKQATSVDLDDVNAAIADIGRAVLCSDPGNFARVKFGGYMLGGVDQEERREKELLSHILSDGIPKWT